jgi:hypothetical protein
MINCTQKLNKMSGDTSPLGIHVKNDIKESGKTKKLRSGQASLRRSGSGGRRKNQTKTICLPSFEGET